MKLCKKLLFTMFCLLFVWLGVSDAQAADVDDAVSAFKDCHVYSINMESIKKNRIVLNWKYRNNYTTDSDHGDYSNPYINIKGFEIQVCTDPGYPAKKVTTYKTKRYVAGADAASYTYRIPLSVLGKNGGKLYARIRAYGTVKMTDDQTDGLEPSALHAGDPVYSDYQDVNCWSGYYMSANVQEHMERDYCEYVKINRQNFGGMYDLIKKGFYDCDLKGKKSYYDKNRDGWLDPSEIRQVNTVSNYSYEKSDGGYGLLTGTEKYQCKLANLKGLKYLPWVSVIRIRDYTGSSLDLSKYRHISDVDIREFWQSGFRLNAPFAKVIALYSETGGSWQQAKLASVDVSKCRSAVYLTIDGSVFQYVTMKLPKSAADLRWISVAHSSAQSIDLNKYKKLNLAYFYSNKFRQCRMSRCTALKYVYFYGMNDVSSVDLRKAKSLKGVDICYCGGLNARRLKTVKAARVTKNRGCWWEDTNAWKKLVDQIYKSM